MPCILSDPKEIEVKNSVLIPKTTYKIVGTNPERHDATDKVTGKAQYGADISLPGMLYGKIIRSPYAHAKIRSIDISEAQNSPDVKSVVTASDFPQQSPVAQIPEMGKSITQNVMAVDRVFYKGHAVAAVSATSLQAAEEATNLIKIDYEILDPVITVEDAIKEDAPKLHPHWKDDPSDPLVSGNIASHLQFKFGDPKSGFQNSDLVIEREFRTKSVHQGYIEPHNATAWWTPEGRLTIWCSSQGQFGVRDNTANVLGIPNSSVQVIPMEIGGGFGGKNPIYLEPIAAMLAKKSGYPVKMTMSRSEIIEATGPTSGSYCKVKIGTTKEGKITAAKASLYFEAGAFPGAPIAGASAAIFSPYNIENIQIDGYDVVNNKPKTAAYRAPGAPIAMFSVETLMEEIARELNLNSMEFRLLNVAVEGDRRADGLINGVIGAKEVMEAVIHHSHYNSPLTKSNQGRGVSMGFCRNNTGMASAIANVISDGRVSLVEGSVDIGGSRTAAAQMFAEVLGIPVEDVIPKVGDTDSIGFTSNTGGSSVAYKTGWAVFEAAKDVKRQLVERAAKLWDSNIKDIEYKDGILEHKSDSELKLTFSQISKLLPETGGPVVGRANLNPAGSGGSYAANIIDVEVDPETGKVDILKITAFQDAGTAIYPVHVEGQIQGGTAQGIGWALNEEYFMGSDGNVVNTSLLDYRMPTSLDLPMINTEIIEVPNPNHPYGVRGVGEANIVPPLAALSNAILDATGVQIRNLPMNPQNVISSLKSN